MKQGVLVIHGIGTQREDFAKAFVEDMLLRVHRAGVEPVPFFEPAFWADVFDTTEAKIWNTVGTGLNFKEIRENLILGAGDAIAYQARWRDAVQARIRQAAAKIAHCDQITIVAHSLGTVIASDFIYDEQKKKPGSVGIGDRIQNFVTFGSPIPLWWLVWGDLDNPVRPKGKWLNFYDKDDVIGFPLANLPAYRPLAAEGVLEDRAINVGTMLTSWNPFSHNGYWKDEDFLKPVAELLAEDWQKTLDSPG